jgi:hypothetical protein
MSAVLSAHENLFAITPGAVGRTERKQALAQVMHERGIARNFDTLGESPSAQPESPIVATFIPYDPGFIQHELADLFVVEYLKQRPDMAELRLPRDAERLQESLDHYRHWQDHIKQASEAGAEK